MRKKTSVAPGMAPHHAALSFLHQHPPLAAEGPALLLLRGRHPHHTEGLGVAAHIAVQPVAQLPGIPGVRLHPLALRVPVLWHHHMVGHPQRR
jgi:hypothetical protein